ncbi:MAG TPA: PEGA domain-containing protein, partial [Gemmatimonadales bacterium]
ARHHAGPPPDLSAARRDVPPNVAGAVRRAMSDAPGQRFANVAEFSAALIGPSRPRVLWPAAGTPEDDEAPHHAPVHRSRRRLLLVVALAVLAVAAGGVWLVWSTGSPSPAAEEDEMVSSSRMELTEPPPLDVVAAPGPAAAEVRAAPPPAARVVVNSMPWAELYMDGRLVGNTPVVDLRLSAGQHRLRLVRPGFKPHEQVVYVAPGQTLRITGIVLQPEIAP